jgi:Putative prokaryotic signal transducing protein
MRELLRSNDLVHLSWAQAILAAEGIRYVLLDDHVSGVEGSIGAIPRRLMVEEHELEQARQLLRQAKDSLAGA